MTRDSLSRSDVDDGEVVHHDVGPVAAELVAVASPVNTYHQTESTATTRLDTGDGVLDNHRS